MNTKNFTIYNIVRKKVKPQRAKKIRLRTFEIRDEKLKFLFVTKCNDLAEV